MQECHILRPELFALVTPLRKLLRQMLGKNSADISLTLAAQGIDCLISGVTPEGLKAQEALIAFAQDQRLARLSLDGGWGAETLWEPEPVTIYLGGTNVGLPAGAFLQPTLDGERVLQADVSAFTAGAGRIADLFAGLGTLSLPLATSDNRVTAFEADRSAYLASRQAYARLPGQSEAQHRDLFRAPLQADELNVYDAVILDPPRAGARAQVEQLALGQVPRIAYVSCNPASWARDAQTLVAAGYRLERLRPVGQFRWSTHVELTSLFTR